MAYVKDEQSTKISIKVVNGDDTLTRSFIHINPDISDADLYTVGENLSGLQTYPLSVVQRTDVATIVEE